MCSMLGVVPAIIISLINPVLHRELGVQTQAMVTVIFTAVPLAILCGWLAHTAFVAAPGRQAEHLYFEMVKGDAKQLLRRQCCKLVSGKTWRNIQYGLAWLSYIWDFVCMSTFAFGSTVPWGANGTTNGTIAEWQDGMQIPVLDLSQLGDGVSQNCFIGVACLFGLMALAVLLMPMPVDKEDTPPVHPVFSSAATKFILKMGFIPAFRLALAITRCQYMHEAVPVAVDVFPSTFLTNEAWVFGNALRRSAVLVHDCH